MRIYIWFFLNIRGPVCTWSYPFNNSMSISLFFEIQLGIWLVFLIALRFGSDLFFFVFFSCITQFCFFLLSNLRSGLKITINFSPQISWGRSKVCHSFGKSQLYQFQAILCPEWNLSFQFISDFRTRVIKTKENIS